MSVSKWAWIWACDHGICVGDCDLCDRPEKLFGNWKKTVDNGTPMLECSACGCRVKRESFMDAVGEKGFSFCPYCGADLREREDIKPRFGKWTPIKTRPMTDDERKDFEENCDCIFPLADEDAFVFDCKMPDDEQNILISTKSGFIFFDTCIHDDYGYGLYERDDWDGVAAWMPLPEPYEGGMQDDRE